MLSPEGDPDAFKIFTFAAIHRHDNATTSPYRSEVWPVYKKPTRLIKFITDTAIPDCIKLDVPS